MINDLNLRIVFISSYVPKKCGIANYTKDLATGINSLIPGHLAEIVAMDDETSEDLNYPWEVKYRVRKEKWEDYRRVLSLLNRNIADVISIQHEFGLYGGPFGKYILRFARCLKKPFIVTFHTILEKPTPQQKKIIKDLGKLAKAVIVLMDGGKEILSKIYNIPQEKVTSIYLGTPDFPFQESSLAKKIFGLEDKIVMLSVNLLGRNKGIHHAIQALPEIIKKHPNFIYLVVGQTHPVLLSKEGEAYRRELLKLVKKLHLENHVKFLNEYISRGRLINYLQASDFFITPYETMEQISSYSLAYAIAFGKICISTPFKYAKEVLAGGAGFLVKLNDYASIAEAVLYAMDNKEEVKKMQQKCYLHGRSMTWARVSFRHVRLLDHLFGLKSKILYPAPSLKHLAYMTTEIGLLEHTYRYVRRMNEGYATDDNARGLVVAVAFNDKKLSAKYLNFLLRSYKDGMMYCDVDKKGKVAGQMGVGDWFGRTIWALAFALRFGETESLRRKSARLLCKLLPSCLKIEHQRPLSHILLGMVILKELEWDKFTVEREQIVNHAFDVIIKGYKSCNSPNWHWSENILTYDNPRIPMALIEAGGSFNWIKAKETGLKMLNFLIDQNFDLYGNHFRFIGNKGWFKKGGERALFDEQPIEAGSMVQACSIAYKSTGIKYYKDMAKKAFGWFHGDNILGMPLYNPEKASVFDGITKNGISLNQGSESILEYLASYIQLELK